MQFIEFVVANPVKVAVGVLLLVLFGVVALFRMPMQLTPEVQTPTITIETRWPGASPQEVEREIVLEQEKQLKSVEGVTKMSSECMDSVGPHHPGVLGRHRHGRGLAASQQPAATGAGISRRRRRAGHHHGQLLRPADRLVHPQRPAARRRKTSTRFQKEHPELAEALEPVRRAHNPGLAMVRLRRLAKEEPAVRELLPPDIDVTKLRRFAEDVIEARFERVPGVSNSNVLGGLEDDLQVIVDPAELAARQVTIADVRNALRLAKRGHLRRRLFGKASAATSSARSASSARRSRWSEQLLAVRDGKPVFVRDVAEVKLGFKKPDGVVRRFGDLLHRRQRPARSGRQRDRRDGRPARGQPRAERRPAPHRAASAPARLRRDRVHPLGRRPGEREHLRRRRADDDRADVVPAPRLEDAAVQSLASR